MLEKVKEEFQGNLKEEIKNQDKYKKLIKELIFQGLVMLMEEEVYVRTRDEDKDITQGMLKDL